MKYFTKQASKITSIARKAGKLALKADVKATNAAARADDLFSLIGQGISKSRKGVKYNTTTEYLLAKRKAARLKSVASKQKEHAQNFFGV